ncbi:6-O-methylguanine DNA methyltransferase, DNA binding domain [mine drainage metagenome]|uniref:6-O-methylguanine DNA methyltransferase, DNA binding domain n=1 Tax=mine drainage metagenome TaxID=410659 RepID=A0A1J5R145_9ZZZZ
MDDDYAESVLEVVRAIPVGRVMTYGLIAEVVLDRQAHAGRPQRGGPRQVGQVLAHAGGEVPWWRVVDASGRPPARLRVEALARLHAEGVRSVGSGDRVAVRTSIWWPDAERTRPG